MTKGATTAAAPLKPEVIDDRILTAAGKLFRGRGYASTTVREIAAAAQMLPGSLHYRYASKDEILIALLERGLTRAVNAIQQVIAAERDPIERLRLALREHLELLVGGEDALYVLLFDWRSLGDGTGAKATLVRERYEAFWSGLIFEAAGTGRARLPLDLDLLKNFGIGAMSYVAQWFDPNGGRTVAQVADTFWHYLAFGLLRDDARPKDVDRRFKKLLETT
jgi:TetR/AcrR family transcriptional regulator, cholesterol catabolism regulator